LLALLPPCDAAAREIGPHGKVGPRVRRVAIRIRRMARHRPRLDSPEL
jgi:hypothetical protein